MEWQAFYQVCPFGPVRDDLRMGISTSVFASAHAKKGHKFTPKDFMPTFGETETRMEPTMTGDEVMAHMRQAFGGRG